MKILDMSKGFRPIDVPAEVAKCPICDAPIVIDDLGEWEALGGMPLGISIECTTEPDLDDDDWDGWHREHWSHPYIDWLPIEGLVLEWFQENYRCE